MLPASLSQTQKTLPTMIRTLLSRRTVFIHSTVENGNNEILCAMSQSSFPLYRDTGSSKTLKCPSRCHSRNIANFHSDVAIPLSVQSFANDQHLLMRIRQPGAHFMSKVPSKLDCGIRQYNILNHGNSIVPENIMFNQIRSITTRSRRKMDRSEARKLSTKGQDDVSTESKSKETSSEKPEEEDDDKQLTLYQRFKKTYKEHGKVVVFVHLVTSTVWFGSFYAIARGGVDIVPYLESWNLSERIISPFKSGGLGDIAVAYLLYKLATPARYTVTIGGTRLAISYLRKGGKMQPVPEGDSLREMYKEGKADLKQKSKTRLKKLNKKQVKRTPPSKEH